MDKMNHTRVMMSNLVRRKKIMKKRRKRMSTGIIEKIRMSLALCKKKCPKNRYV